MTNKTKYTPELLLKGTRAIMAKQRRINIIIGLIAGAYGILVVATTLVSERVLAEGAALMFFIALMMLISVFKTRKTKLYAQYLKQEYYNPNKVYEYILEDEKFVVVTTSEKVQGKTAISYDYIEKTMKIDDKTILIMLKNNQYYIIEDESGIAPIYEFVDNKIKNRSQTAV